MKKTLFLSLIAYLVSSLFLPQATASTMSGDNYSIENQQLDIQPFQQKKEEKKEVEKPTKQAGKNYTIETNQTPFVFSIKDPLVDFGELSTTNPVIRTTEVKIQSTNPYTVFSSANHALLLPNKTILPDTTCDNGSCSEITAALWENTLTYGFGYRCEGSGSCGNDFKQTNYFRQFADLSKKEEPQLILNNQEGKTQEASIIYKVNISGTQPAGAYTNDITYIAIPGF